MYKYWQPSPFTLLKVFWHIFLLTSLNLNLGLWFSLHQPMPAPLEANLFTIGATIKLRPTQKLTCNLNQIPILVKKKKKKNNRYIPFYCGIISILWLYQTVKNTFSFVVHKSHGGCARYTQRLFRLNHCRSTTNIINVTVFHWIIMHVISLEWHCLKSNNVNYLCLPQLYQH